MSAVIRADQHDRPEWARGERLGRQIQAAAGPVPVDFDKRETLPLQRPLAIQSRVEPKPGFVPKGSGHVRGWADR